MKCLLFWSTSRSFLRRQSEVRFLRNVLSPGTFRTKAVLVATIAIDTESTGLQTQHGCRPFMILALNEEGNFNCWEWEVDPLTRSVYDQKIDGQCQQVLSMVEDKKNRFVLHNSTFDVDMIETGLGIEWPWDRTEDTLTAAHIVDNLESHGLNDLALRYCGVPEDDEKRLEEVVKKCRRQAPEEWKIASKENIDWVTGAQTKWWKMDLWLPKAMADKGMVPKEWGTLCREYGKRDVLRTLLLWRAQKEYLNENDLWELYRDQVKVLPVFRKMKKSGITIDTGRAKDFSSRLQHEERTARTRIRKCLAFFGEPKTDWNSPIQLRRILYEVIGLPVRIRTDKKNEPSTKRIAFELGIEDCQTARKDPHTKRRWDTAEELLTNLITVSRLVKQRQYVDEYLKKSVWNEEEKCTNLYPFFNPHATVTTRLSSSDPNATNIPKKVPDDEDDPSILRGSDGRPINVRYVWGPAPGRIWVPIDYSNIEMRLFAILSNDKKMLDGFRAGMSFHMMIAEVLHPEKIRKMGVDKFKKSPWYSYVKNGNFALLYGGSAAKVNATYKVADGYDRLVQHYDRAGQYMREVISLVRRQGYVETIDGYPLRVPRNKPYKGLNYCIQGSAGSIIKRAMVRCQKVLDDWQKSRSESTGQLYRANIVAMIHDELIFDLPKIDWMTSEGPLVYALKRAMEQTALDLGADIPAEPDVCLDNWRDGKPVNFSKRLLQSMGLTT